MELQQVSPSCYAILAGNNRLCDANSGFVRRAGGVVIDTQSDLGHARLLRDLVQQVFEGRPRRVINTHEDIDHVAGNAVFDGSEVIAHRSVRESIHHAADPRPLLALQRVVRVPQLRGLLRLVHPGVVAVGEQLRDDFDFRGLRIVPPTTVFDETLTIDLDGAALELIPCGPSHQRGDTLIFFPEERVLFAGDIVFHQCTPIGWTGHSDHWLRALGQIESLQPEVIVPGHGPVCGLTAVVDLREYLELVRRESRRLFDAGVPVFEAACRIEIGRFLKWRAPARLFANVARAYREFRGEPFDKPWNSRVIFDAIYRLAVTRGWPVEF